VVSHGLLTRLDSQDQLAFVLGHEMAHVLMRHHDKGWLVKSQRHVIAAGEVGKGMADGIATATKAKKGDGKEFQNWSLIADGALIASRDVISPAWNRGQEDQADLLGVDIMVAAGYQPREVLKVLQVLEGIEFGTESPERRSAENAYAQWGKKVVAQNRSTPLGDMGNFFDKAIDEVGSAIGQTLADARRSHRSVEERTTQIRDYARREYASVNTQASAQSYKSALASPRTKQVLQNYAQSTSALQKLVQGSTNAASAPAQKGVAAPTERDSYPRLILSQVQFTRGDRKGAIASLQSATQGPNPALRAYLVLSETYAKAGDHKSAWAVAEAAQKRYHQSEMLLVHRISLKARAGQRNEAQSMAVQCKLEYPALEDACADAAKRGVSSVK
jgi:predicted Zn-dependent protease